MLVKPGAAEDTLSRPMSFQGQTRNSLVRLGSQPLKPNAALLLVLHGEGGSANSAQRWESFDHLADDEGVVVIYPEALHRHWNDGRGAEAYPEGTAQIDDVGYLRELIRLAAQEYKTDPKKVFVCGFSSGAMMAQRLAAEAPEVAAVAAVGGALPASWGQNFKPPHPVSVLLIQGSADPVVPYQGGAVRFLQGRERGRVLSSDDSVQRWSQGAPLGPPVSLADDANDGCKAWRQSVQVGPGEVCRIRIEGGGHTWPGGRQYLPASLVGPVCHDFEAGPVIWEFLKSHPKP